MEKAFDAITVSHATLPDGVEIKSLIAKGANNAAYRAKWNDMDCVLRVPRRKSDTQQRGSACGEWSRAVRAAELGVGPKVYKAWFAKHATDDLTSGLYLLLERFDFALEDVIGTNKLPMSHARVLGGKVVHLLTLCAENGLFLYDLKPGNIVYRVDGDDGIKDVRIIDYGCDFCELEGSIHSPMTNFVQMLAEGNVELAKHLRFAAMFAQISSVTTYQLYHDRHKNKLGAIERSEANPFAKLFETFLDSMREGNIGLLRKILRQDCIKGVLKHYNTRRNAGTHRTLKFARGIEA